tara:strand:- start:690 stop:1637 length:948 start_codon:yes stop_codon:yes gene_type:complete
MKKNIALIGCGYWGNNLLRTYNSLGVLSAIYDANEDLAQNKSIEYSVPYREIDEIFSDKSIEGIVIAAPAPLHYSIASQALNNNKHVFVEKPISMELDEANDLIDKSQSKKLKLMVGHIMQYHPVFKQLKDLVHSGRIGDINYIYSNRKAFGKFRTEENVVLSIAPHDVSMILSLVGEFPSSISSFKGSYLQEGIDDFANIHLGFTKNIKASINVSWLNPVKEQKLVVVGSKGMLVLDDTLDWDKKLALFEHEIHWNASLPLPIKKDIQHIIVPYAEPLKEECTHFINLINGNVTDVTDGVEGRDVLAVLKAVNK